MKTSNGIYKNWGHILKEVMCEVKVQMIGCQLINSALTSKTTRESKIFEFKLTQICFNLIKDSLSVYTYR